MAGRIGGSKNYLQLFEAIDRQQIYNEKKLIAQVDGKTVKGQFPVAKNYLYNLILKSLANFYSGPGANLTAQQLQIRVLMDKNLYNHADKLLRKALRDAERTERFHEHHQLLDMKLEIMLEKQNEKALEMKVQEIVKEKKEVIEQLQNLDSYKFLMTKSYRITLPQEGARKYGEEDPFKEIVEDQLMSDEGKAISSKAKILFYGLWRNKYSYDYKKDFAKAIESGLKQIEIFESSQFLMNELAVQYVRELSQLSLLYFRNKKNSEGVEILERIRDFNTDNPKAKLAIFERYYLFSLANYINSGNLEEGFPLVEELIERLPNFKGKIIKSQELFMYYALAYFYLLAERPSDALYWSNQFLNEPRTEVRVDLQSIMRILNIVLHYEMNNFDLVEYLLKSTSRFITKRGRMYDFERKTLYYFKAFTQVDSQEELLNLYKEFDKELAILFKNPFEQHAMNSLNLQAWVRGKIEGRPLYHMVQVEMKEAIQK